MSNTPITVPDDEWERLRAAIAAGDWPAVATALGGVWTRTEMLGPDDEQRAEVEAAVEAAGYTVDGLIDTWNRGEADTLPSGGGGAAAEPTDDRPRQRLRWPPDLDPSEISAAEIDDVLAAAPSADAAFTWLTENAGAFDEETFNAGQQAIEDRPDAEGGPSVNPVLEATEADDAELARAAAEGEPAAEAELERREADATEEAIDAAAEVWGRTDSGIQPDMSGVEELVPEGLSPEERERWIADVTEQGYERALDERAGDIQGETGASDEESRAMAEGTMSSLDLFDTAEPDWLLAANGGVLSDDQKRRYVDYWNDAYGTAYRDFDTELAPILAGYDGTETVIQNFTEAVFADQEPLITEGIELPLVSGRRTVSYTTDEMGDLRSMGFSNDAITRLVRLSAITDTETEDDLRGTARHTAPLAALLRYHGGGEEFALFNQTQQEINQLEQSLGLRPGEYSGMTFEERQELREELKRQVPGGAPAGEAREFERIDETFNELENRHEILATREEKGATPGIIAAQGNFRRGMEEYRGDELLAFVHAIDPALAQSVASTGGDPDLLDWEDNAAVYDILERAGQIPESGARLRQLESATGFFGYFNTGRGPQGGGGGGGAGPARRMVDPAAVREQVQQLWSRMFLADVDDATVEAITKNLQNQLDEAPEGMSFDVSARIQQFLRGQDVYDELYRNKPEGLTEEEYQGQFASGVSDILGAETDVGALRAGMETGDYQTAVGRAASTEKLLTNSTLRGRWAQAKQTLDQFS